MGKRKKSVFDYEVEIIRKALKSLAPTLSVRRARGTAYGWIDIWGSGEFHEFTEREKRALEKLGLSYGANCSVISPESRRYYVEKAAKLLGIELPEPVKREYEERDEYRRKMEEEALRRKKMQLMCEHEFVVMPYVVIGFPDGEVWRCKKCGMEKVILDKNPNKRG